MNTYIGIDLHKRTQTWVILSEDGKSKLLTKTFKVTPEEVTLAIKLAKSTSDNKLIVAIEPVCGWLWVVAMLRKEGFEVHISNTRKTRAISDSLQKTDENDAHILARLCKTGMMYESFEVSPKMQALRSLVRERGFLIRTRAGMKCRLESVVTRSGRHLIKSTLRSKKGTDAIIASNEPEWKRALNAIADVNKYIDELDREVAKHAKEKIPTLLMSIPGIGPVTAVSIWAEVGDFTRFSSPQKLCAYAGLVPSERSSGEKQKLGHITKAGSKVLRYVLVEAAMHIRDSERSIVLYNFYSTIKEKRGAMCARVALARKILGIIWYMVNRNEIYEQRFQT